MRFIDCSNCLSSSPDDLEKKLANGTNYLNNNTKRSRLHRITKAIFSTSHRSTNDNNKKVSSCDSIEIKGQTNARKYCVERKHKVKKRDLVKRKNGDIAISDQHSGICGIILLTSLRLSA